MTPQKTKMGAVRITITIPPFMYNWIKQQIQEGRFATISEAIRQGLYLLRESHISSFVRSSYDREI